jgi:hypothetical protein
MTTLTGSSGLRLALFTIAAAAACTWAPHAAADNTVPATDLGTQADVGGGQQWTVTGLQPSADTINAAPAGSLWEATATATPADGGIPVVPGFAARTPGGQNYPVLWNVPTPLGITPAPLPAGETATGKLYFDVPAGATPDAVTYTRDGQDVAVWVQPQPVNAPAAATHSGTTAYAAPMPAAPAPVTAPRAPAPAAPASAGLAPAAGGSTGTPAPAAASTPPPATPGSVGTPAQAATGSAGTPATPGPTPAPPTTAPASTPTTASSGTTVSPVPAIPPTPAAAGH